MASTRARKLGRWGVLAMSCALGCATGTQGDDPALGLSGESGAAGTFSNGETAGQGGSSPAAAGSEATGSAGATTFAGFTSGGTFGMAGTFGSAGTPSASGSGGAGTGSGGKAGGAGQGGSGGASAGTAGNATAGTAGSGGSKAGGCASTKLTVTGASGTEERADLGPEFAIDGDMVTRWASEKSEPQTLDLDLGEAVTVNRVVINWEAAYATSFQLQIASNAAGPFTTIYSDTAGDGGTDDITTLTASDGRYLRMNGLVRKTAYGFSIYELAVYGDKDEACQ